MNLLEQLIELEQIFYLLDHWFVTKCYTSGITRWKSFIGERTLNFHALVEHKLSPNLHMFTSLEALQTPSFWGVYGALIIEAWLIKLLTIDD